MLQETFVITNKKSNQLEIENTRSNSCNHCQVNGQCGVGLFSRYFQKPLRLSVEDNNYQVGQTISLYVSHNTILKDAFILYMVPLLVLLTTLLLVQTFISPNPLALVLLVMSAFFASFFVIKYYYRYQKNRAVITDVAMKNA